MAEDYLTSQVEQQVSQLLLPSSPAKSTPIELGA
jgi:hypothetical protein